MRQRPDLAKIAQNLGETRRIAVINEAVTEHPFPSADRRRLRVARAPGWGGIGPGFARSGRGIDFGGRALVEAKA